jgi:hypothetical protein
MYSSKELDEFVDAVEFIENSNDWNFLGDVLYWLMYTKCKWLDNEHTYDTGPFIFHSANLDKELNLVKDMLKKMDNWDRGNVMPKLAQLSFNNSLKVAREYWRRARVDDGFTEFKKEGE